MNNNKPLSPKDVEWVVNNIGELGVRINGVSYFLYKGESIVYSEAESDDYSPTHVRPVGKREFGEVCRSPHFRRRDPKQRYNKGEGWISLTSPEDKMKADKPFHSLTRDEATDLARNCTFGAKSEDEIRYRLTEAGFDGVTATLTSTTYSTNGMTMFMAMGMVYGPQGEVINF